MKKKICSYEKLDHVIMETLESQDEFVLARQIESKILEDYKVNKVKLSPVSIGKRLQGNPSVRVLSSRRGKLYKAL